MVDLRNGNAVTKEEIDNVTKWDSYRLQQVTADSFEVKKRTGHEECTFIKANWGKRSKRSYVHCGRNKRYGILYAQLLGEVSYINLC